MINPKQINVTLGWPKGAMYVGSKKYTTVDGVDQAIYIGISSNGERPDMTYILSEWSEKKDLKKPKIVSDFRWEKDSLYGEILVEKEREEPKRLEGERRIEFSHTPPLFQYLDELIKLNPGYELFLDGILNKGLDYMNRLNKMRELSRT